MECRKTIRTDKALILLLLLIFIERIFVFFELGADFTLGSDDVSYMEAGIHFIKTGIISIHNPYPTAMIMPGMPVITGIFFLIFGEGQAMLTALKVFWMIIGTATAYMTYKAVRLFTGRSFALLAAAGFLIPNWAWADNIILTETPFSFLLMCCIYFTLAMGEKNDRRYFVLYVLSFMAALMFRANIMSMAVFTAVYLIIVKRNAKKLLMKRAVVFICAALCFFIPWSARNYAHFGSFMPLGYGVGNPLLLGTYQGENYPEDSELDYEADVWPLMEQQYGAYMDGEGRAKDPAMAQYLSLRNDELTARYRIKVWRENDPASFYKSYLFLKPRWMLNWPWYWNEVLHFPYEAARMCCRLNFLLCSAAVLLSLILKKFRKPVLFLTITYFINLYIYASAFASDRYSSTIMMMRFVLAGLALSLICDVFRKIKNIKKGHFQA